jgi:2-C-methyl-D-erythritol 4-phosphate cytidylyltransferase
VLAAVLLAGGASARVGEDKVLADLGGVPLFLWGASRLVSHRRVDARVVVVRPEALGAVEDAAAGLRKLAAIVPGGSTRAGSARAGLAAARTASHIIVHDAARPFVDEGTIERVLEALDADGAAAAALPVGDTVRRAADGWADEAVERTGLWAMQTPQAFDREAIAEAYARTRGDPTDCAAAARERGIRVRLVRGHPLNFKVTSAEDLGLARALVAAGLVRPALARTGA